MEECTCLCHKDKNIVHCVACCNKCPYCDKNIRMAYYDEHVEKCKNKKVVYEEIKPKKIGVISYKEIAEDPRMIPIIESGIKSIDKCLKDQEDDLSLISTDAKRKIFGKNNDN